jgi:SecY
MTRPRRPTSTITAISRDKGDAGGFLPRALLGKVAQLIALVAASRVGVYDRLPGVDIGKFSEAVASNGVLGYIDNITGGSISNVGVFSLGIIPAINASIFLQILTISFPGLKKMAREEGPQGKARYQLYQKLATLGFATAQAFGQLNALKCARTCCPCRLLCRHHRQAPTVQAICALQSVMRSVRSCVNMQSAAYMRITAPLQAVCNRLLAGVGAQQHVCARRGRDGRQPVRRLRH